MFFFGIFIAFLNIAYIEWAEAGNRGASLLLVTHFFVKRGAFSSCEYTPITPQPPIEVR